MRSRSRTSSKAGWSSRPSSSACGRSSRPRIRSSSSAPEKYDLIFVASLFTHLPRVDVHGVAAPSRGAARRRRGCSIFSVHDEVARAGDGRRRDPFESRSESRVLDVNEYGSTWVTEAYVREQVAAIDPAFACIRMPRALARVAGRVRHLAVADRERAPRRVPKGLRRSIGDPRGGRRICRAGRPASTEPADRVDVRLGDVVVATTASFGHAPDVAASFGGLDTATDSGWHLTIPHGAIRSFRYRGRHRLHVHPREAKSASSSSARSTAAAGVIARERAAPSTRQVAERNKTIADLRQASRSPRTSARHARAADRRDEAEPLLARPRAVVRASNARRGSDGRAVTAARLCIYGCV